MLCDSHETQIVGRTRAFHENWAHKIKPFDDECALRAYLIEPLRNLHNVEVDIP